jgi:hypothetical protein
LGRRSSFFANKALSIKEASHRVKNLAMKERVDWFVSGFE